MKQLRPLLLGKLLLFCLLSLPLPVGLLEAASGLEAQDFKHIKAWIQSRNVCSPEELANLNDLTAIENFFKNSKEKKDSMWDQAIEALTGLKRENFQPQKFLDYYKAKGSDAIFEWPMLKKQLDGSRINTKLFQKLAARKKEREIPYKGIGNYPNTEGSSLSASTFIGGTMKNAAVKMGFGALEVGKGLHVKMDSKSEEYLPGGKVRKLLAWNSGRLWLFDPVFFQDDLDPKNAYGGWLPNMPIYDGLEESYCLGNDTSDPTDCADVVGPKIYGTAPVREKAKQNRREKSESWFFNTPYFGDYRFYRENKGRETINLPEVNRLLTDDKYVLKLIAEWQKSGEKVGELQEKKESLLARFCYAGGKKFIKKRDGRAYLDVDGLMKELFLENYKWLFSLDGLVTLSQLDRTVRQEFLRQRPAFSLPSNIGEELEIDQDSFEYLTPNRKLFRWMMDLDKFFKNSSPYKKGIGDRLKDQLKKRFEGFLKAGRAVFKGLKKEDKLKEIDNNKIEGELIDAAKAFTQDKLDPTSGLFVFTSTGQYMEPVEESLGLHQFTSKPLVRHNYYVHDTSSTHTYYKPYDKKNGYSYDLNDPENSMVITSQQASLRDAYENGPGELYESITEKIEPDDCLYHQDAIKEITVKKYPIEKKTNINLLGPPTVEYSLGQSADEKSPRETLAPLGPRYTAYRVSDFPAPNECSQYMDPEVPIPIPIHQPKGVSSYDDYKKYLSIESLMETFINLQKKAEKIKELREEHLKRKLELAKQHKLFKIETAQNLELKQRKQDQRSELKRENLEHAINFLLYSGLLYRLTLGVVAVVTLFFFLKNLFPHLMARLYKEPLPTIITDHNLPDDSWFGFFLNLLGARKEPEREKFLNHTYYPKEVSQQLNKLLATWRAILKHEIKTGKKGVYTNTILYGPPGTGKSLYVKVAAEVLNKIPGAEVYYVIVPCAAFSQGDRATAMKNFVTLINLFIRQSKKAGRLLIVCFDESPSCFPPRGGKRSSNLTDLMTTYFLSSFPDASQEGIIFVATTNFHSSLDQAFASRMRKPGIYVDRPDQEALQRMIKDYLIKFRNELGSGMKEMFKVHPLFFSKELQKALALDLFRKGYTARDVRPIIHNLVRNLANQNMINAGKKGSIKRLDEETFRDYFPERAIDTSYEEEEARITGRNQPIMVR